MEDICDGAIIVTSKPQTHAGCWLRIEDTYVPKQKQSKTSCFAIRGLRMKLATQAASLLFASYDLVVSVRVSGSWTNDCSSRAVRLMRSFESEGKDKSIAEVSMV